MGGIIIFSLVGIINLSKTESKNGASPTNFGQDSSTNNKNNNTNNSTTNSSTNNMTNSTTNPSTNNGNTNNSTTNSNSNKNNTTNSTTISSTNNGTTTTKYTISFSCAGCNQTYNSISIAKDGLIPTPTKPHKNGYVFKYWTSNGAIYDFSKAPKGNITLTAEFEKPKWKVLWIFLAETNYNGTIAKISELEAYQISLKAGKAYETFIEQRANIDIVNTYKYENSRVNASLDTSSAKYGPQINTDDASSILKKNGAYNNGSIVNYDSVIVIGNMNPWKSQMKYYGLTWSWDRYSFVPYPSSEAPDIFIHEWLHQIEWWYGKTKGRSVPDLHNNAAYGFPQENANGWKDWYSFYLSKIDKDWWTCTPLACN